MDTVTPDATAPRSRYAAKARFRWSEAFEVWRAARDALGPFHPDTWHRGRQHSAHCGLAPAPGLRNPSHWSAA